MAAGKGARVVYLFGAGATHGSIKAVKAPTGLLMRDLAPHLAAEAHSLVTKRPRFRPMQDVVNDIIVDEVDFEHIITFFEESSSAVHREFADQLRRIFERVLKRQLQRTKRTLKESRLALYAALFDMYNVDGIDERLHGVLTLNYDDYIEAAAKSVCGVDVDFGIDVGKTRNGRVPVLKLHGSFGWEDVWPVRARRNGVAKPLWIPPGIRKVKDRYPFNLVWGRAREVLDCDVLRVVGCRLGPSDWDLISLLFSTRHAHADRRVPYRIEVIDSPRHAEQLKRDYAYLDVQSVLEIETHDVGQKLIFELGGDATPFRDLKPEEAEDLLEVADAGARNWFQMWLVQMAEGIQNQLGEEATSTRTGAFRKWLGV